MKNFKLLEIIRCPECKSSLIAKELKLICNNCNASYYHTQKIINLLPQKSKLNKYNMDYLEHYRNDAEMFDYFEKRDYPATIHDELRVKQFILSHIKGNNNIILDVGSGSAWVAENLSDNNIVISMDIAEINIKKALDKIKNPEHYGIVADALSPPFNNNSFDYIIASEIIEHIVEPDLFINELSKTLKPNGKLIITTPYKEKIHYSQCIHCNKITPKNAHLHSFDEKKLTSFANNNISVEKYIIFGNKALLLLRTHIILQFLPFKLWKIIDQIVNIIIPKMNHILIIFNKNEQK